jgi:hypothetical protein
MVGGGVGWGHRGILGGEVWQSGGTVQLVRKVTHYGAMEEQLGWFTSATGNLVQGMG